MKLLRRADIQFALDDSPRFDLASVLAGGDGLDTRPRILAYAATLAEPAELSVPQLAALAGMAAGEAVDEAVLAGRHGADTIMALLERGLLVPAVAKEGAPVPGGDGGAVDWWPPARLAHLAGAWRGVDIARRRDDGKTTSTSERVAEFGPAPTHDYAVPGAGSMIELPPPPAGPLDDLLQRRRTCRNFDTRAELPMSAFSAMLRRVWGVIGTRELAPGAVAVKKSSPAGGGLHALEAFVLVRRVQGLAPGLYHYRAMHHAVEPLRKLTGEEAAAMAYRFLAGQDWFLDAPVLVVMVARFDRLFWKYRRHAKAWRVLHLEAGHLSQTMYLSAAELGLGAFVTAAINDAEIDEELRLPPMRQGTLAIVGFGPATGEARNIELEPVVPSPATRRLGR